jgi:dienelactone hydrolase
MFLRTLLLAAGFAAAASHTTNVKTIAYQQDSTALEGKVVSPKSKGKLPGIVLMPDWMGVTPQAVAYAKQVSDWGYVVFVADLYGKDAQPKNTQDAGKLAGTLKGNIPLLRQRAAAALAMLKQQPGVDTTQIAGMGFCFGGQAILELARSGAELKGVASIHGNLNTTLPQDSKNIKGKVLVLQGAEDPYATQAQALTFMDEMRQAGTDWSVIFYGGAVHAFTNPGAGSDPKQGVAFNPEANRRAFVVLKDFFAETL